MTPKPWDVPNCPECNGHAFAARSMRPDLGEWRCHRCERYFDDD